MLSKMNGLVVAMGVAAAVVGCRTAPCTCDCCVCGGVRPVCSPEELADGFEPLFNGTDMAGWVVKGEAYHVAPGGIMAFRHDRSGSIRTAREFADFVLRYDFKLSCDCNNGLAVRVPANMDTYNGGFEIQMIDDEGSMYTTTFPQLGIRHNAYQRHGAVYGVVPPKVRENGRSYLNPVGEWNHQEVEMRGSHLKVTLNGTVIQDVNLDDYPIDGTSMDHAKHAGIRSRKGYLGWLSHGYPCWWKNIRIKELK